MTLDAKMASVGLKLLDKFGVISRLSKDSKVNDPTTGTVVTTTEFVDVLISPPLPRKSSRKQGETTKDEGSVCYVAGSGLTLPPEEGMTIDFINTPSLAGVVHRITEVDAFYSGALVAAYKVMVKA